MTRTVCVVGCGAAGLVSIKSCLEEGLQVTCYEQSNSIGGTWYYTKEKRENQGPTAYDRLFSNTSIETTCFSDFPFPDDSPHYFSHQQALQYFEIDPYIPDVPGLDTFGKSVMTLCDYRCNEVFRDKVVLIIGNSYTAGDITSDAAAVAKQVYLSVGEGTWCFPRYIGNNQPSDFLFSRKASYWTRTEKLIQNIYNVLDAMDHTHTGLGGGKCPAVAPVMISDTMRFDIGTGRVKVKGYTVAFDKDFVKFEDNSKIGPIDVVFLATGFNSSYPVLEGILPGKPMEHKFYKQIWPVELQHPTLAVIGFTALLCSLWPVYELQGRWVSQVMTGKKKLPSVATMQQDITQYKDSLCRFWGKIKLVPECVTFKDSLADLAGCKPNYWKYIITDPAVAWVCFFQPLFTAQYRLEGLHTWPEARQRLLQAFNRTITATRSRNVQTFKPEKLWFSFRFTLMIVGVCFVIFIAHCLAQ